MEIEAFPVGFYCEYQESISRVFALVADGDRPPALTAVVDVGDANLAHRIACVLNALRETRSAPALDEEVADVERLLPEASRPAYRTAVQQLIYCMWPAPRMSSRFIEEGPSDRFHDTNDEEERSPEEARLAEMPGPVVRLWRLTEVHVHDAARTLHAAESTGRMIGQVPEDDPKRLVEAIGVLLDDERSIPGGDNIFDEYIGSILDPSTDELADFRPVPLPEFTTGRRANEPRRRTSNAS